MSSVSQQTVFLFSCSRSIVTKRGTKKTNFERYWLMWTAKASNKLLNIFLHHFFIVSAFGGNLVMTRTTGAMFTTRKMAWRIATQIVLFLMLTMLLFTTHSIAQKLHKKMEQELLLQNKFSQYMFYEETKRKFSSHYFEHNTIDI